MDGASFIELRDELGEFPPCPIILRRELPAFEQEAGHGTSNSS